MRKSNDSKSVLIMTCKPEANENILSAVSGRFYFEKCLLKKILVDTCMEIGKILQRCGLSSINEYFFFFQISEMHIGKVRKSVIHPFCA
jgi:hypothetical protein